MAFQSALFQANGRKMPSYVASMYRWRTLGYSHACMPAVLLLLSYAGKGTISFSNAVLAPQAWARESPLHWERRAHKGGAGCGGVGQRIDVVDGDVGNAVKDRQRLALLVPACRAQTANTEMCMLMTPHHAACMVMTPKVPCNACTMLTSSPCCPREGSMQGHTPLR